MEIQVHFGLYLRIFAAVAAFLLPLKTNQAITRKGSAIIKLS